MALVLLHLLKQFVNRLCFRDKSCRTDGILQIMHWFFPCRTVQVALHRIPDMKNPHNVVNIFFINRESGFILLQHKGKCFFQRFLSIQCYDIFPVRHDIFCIRIHIFKNVGDHLHLTSCQNTFFIAFQYFFNDFFCNFLFIFIVRKYIFHFLK